MTDERLRSWLDADQASQERLCVAVLSLDRRVAKVRPRQPKGGPDGGYDIEATFQDGKRAIGAIGFKNSPSDSRSDQAWIKRKFAADLKRASQTAGEFGVFVFMTNVRVTVGTRQRLVEQGNDNGVVAEVFDRESLRLALDSPEGLASRFQILQIPLGEAEQAAFFARWGADLERLVTQSFAAMDERLRRLEFMQERAQPLTTIGFHLWLKEPTPIAELPHVRAILSIGKITADANRSQWHVAVCNNAPIRAIPSCGFGPCLATEFWLDDHARSIGRAASTRNDPFSVVGASSGFHEFSDVNYIANLSHLDEAFFALFMNRKLIERVTRVEVYANEYLLWSGAANDLSVGPPNEDPETPWTFSADELADPWVRVMSRLGATQFDFSSMTPRRMFEAQRL